MPDENITCADVSGIRCAKQDPQAHVTDGLHRSRAWEVLKGNALAIAIAMGSVFAARRIAPSAMLAAEGQAANLITRYGNKNCRGSMLQEASRKSVNTALMLSSGLCTGITSQTLFARNRRGGYEIDAEVSVKRDVTRLLTGWSFGAAGASAAYYMAERYGHIHVHQAEKFLDLGLKGAEYATGNSVSEGLVANVIMTAGAIPVNVVGQRMYDALFAHPAYEKQR